MVDFITQLTLWLQGIMGLFFTGYEEQFLSIVLYTVAIMFYAIIIWNLYRFMAKQDIFLFKGMEKAKIPTWISFLLYFIVFPVVAFVGFLFFALLLIFMAKAQSLEQILIISVTLIAAIRITAYYEEDLSKDLAKMIPLALLGVFLVDPSYYSLSVVVDKLVALPTMVDVIIRYLIFVVLLEWILRILLRIRLYVHAPPKKE